MRNELKIKTKKAIETQEWLDVAHPCKALLAVTAMFMSLVLCSACTSIPTKTPDGVPVFMDQNEFTAYVERVFRHHNNVVNESLFATTDALNDKNDPVLKAEMSMDHACQPLNEVVSATATGQPVDFSMKMKLGEAVPACEAATRTLEQLLAKQKAKPPESQ